MVWYEEVLNAIIIIFSYLWQSLLNWLYLIFVVPFAYPSMLWILVPVWLSWFFSEFFQEKLGTSLGNAMTNGAVVLWAAIDCTRETVRLMTLNEIPDIWGVVLRFCILAVLFIYSILIIYLGIKGYLIIEKIARVREVTYIVVIFVPMFYNAIEFSFNYIFGAILFFPLFYYAIELIDRFTPNPQAIIEEEAK